jgi:hypothetical protein
VDDEVDVASGHGAVGAEPAVGVAGAGEDAQAEPFGVGGQRAGATRRRGAAVGRGEREPPAPTGGQVLHLDPHAVVAVGSGVDIALGDHVGHRLVAGHAPLDRNVVTRRRLDARPEQDGARGRVERRHPPCERRWRRLDGGRQHAARRRCRGERPDAGEEVPAGEVGHGGHRTDRRSLR